MDDPFKEIKTIIRSVLVSSQDALNKGCSASTLMRDYKEIAYESIPFKKYGCSNLEELAYKMPDVIQVIRTPTETLYKPVSSADTKRIESLVSRQRKSRKKKSLSKGRRPVAKSSSWQRPNVRPPRQTPVKPQYSHPSKSSFFRPPSRVHRQSPPKISKPVAMVPPSIPERAMNFSRGVRGTTPAGHAAHSAQDVQYASSYDVPPHCQKKMGKLYTSQAPHHGVDVQLHSHSSRSLKTDYKSAINLYVQYHQYPKPIYDTITIGNRGKLRYNSTVIVNDVPYACKEPCLSKKEAEQGAAKQACFELYIDVGKLNVSKPSKKPFPQVDDTLLKERIRLILNMKPNGLFSTRLAALYRDAFESEPPDQAYLDQKLAEWTDCIKIEDITATKTRILYPVLQSNIKLTQSSVPSHDVVPDVVTPPCGSSIRGYVSYVVNMNQLYVQRSEDIHQIEQLQNAINDTYESRGSPKQLLNAEPGCFCVAKFENAWYRAKIISVMKDEQQQVYKLFYIDYGNCEEVPSLRVRRILENFCSLPGQALLCSLASVYPKGGSWSKDVFNKFIHTYDFSEEMLIEVLSVTDSCCSVKMCKMDSPISINEDVVKRGLADSSPLPSEPGPIEFPPGKEWDVFVSYIMSTVAVIIRIVGPNYSEELEALEEQALPKLESEKFKAGQLTPHTLCAVKTREGVDIDWYRVRVVRVQGQKAEVYFLDHGDTDVVNIGDLRPLPAKYNQLPYQAITCKLTGLESFESDSRVLKALSECALGKTCVADVDDRCDKLSLTLWDTSSDMDININEKVSTVLTIEDLKPKLPEEGDTVECYVTHVTDEGRVYINIQGPGLLELNNMSDELNQIYSKLDVKLFLSNPEKGHACVAKYIEEDYEGWYRALIKEVYPKQRKVLAFYVDYGNTQVLPFSSLRQLSPQSRYLKPLPMQALPCQLYDLPPKGCTFTDRIVARIVQLCPLNEVRIVEVVRRPLDGLPKVELYSVDDEDVMQGVSEILLQENLFSEDTPAEPVVHTTKVLEQLHVNIEAATAYQRHRLISEEEVHSLSSTSPQVTNILTSQSPQSEPCSPASDRDVVEYRDMMTGYATELQEEADLTPKTPTSPLSPLVHSQPAMGQSGVIGDQDEVRGLAASPKLVGSSETLAGRAVTKSGDGDSQPQSATESLEDTSVQSIKALDDFTALTVDNTAGVFQDSDLDHLVSPPPVTVPSSGDKVYITWVADPTNFRCIPAEAISQLSDLMEQMLVYYTKQKNMLGLHILPDRCSEGDIAAGFYDGFWYRVCLKKILTTQAAVHFVDYGDYTIIPLSDLRVLTAPFRSLPFQALKAKLAGIQCRGDGWSVEAVDRFKELVTEKTFTAWIHGQEGDYLCVTLLDETATPQHTLIHQILLREDLVSRDTEAEDL